MKLPIGCITEERCGSIVKSVFDDMDGVISKFQSIHSEDSGRDTHSIKSFMKSKDNTFKNKINHSLWVSTTSFNESVSIIYDFLTEGTDPAIFNVPRENFIFTIIGEGPWLNYIMAVVSVNSRHKQRSIEVLFEDKGLPYTYITNIEDLGLLKYQLMNFTLLSTVIDDSGKCGKIEFVVGAESLYNLGVQVVNSDDDPLINKTLYTHDISNMCPGARKYLDDVAKMATVLSISKGSSCNNQCPSMLLHMSSIISSNRMASHDEMMDMLREHWEVTPGFFKYHGIEAELPKVRAK